MPPPDRMRWWALVAGVFVAAALLGVFLLARPVRPPPPPPEPRPLRIDPPPLPIPPPPLSQRELVAAAARAATAQALGEPVSAADRELVGRRFLIRVPFGCAGVSEDEVGAWAYDAARQVVTLQVKPQDWSNELWVRQLAGAAAIDAVEGFWLPRLIGEDCAADAEVAQTLGLAMYFEPNSSRLLRREGRPYGFTGKAGPPTAEGYRLVLAGRIEGFDGAEPVRCRKDAPAEQPVCLLAVAFDRIAFEDPVGGETLAEWRMN